MQSHFLAEIESFNVEALKRTETHVTTAYGKQYVEKKDSSGRSIISIECEKGLGFCPDLMTPDLTVGVAMHGVLVGSEEVAHDLSRLNELGVTHILNVAYGIPNSFPDDFQYMNIEMLDTLKQDFLKHYPKCKQFIDAGRIQGNVLVHCHAGRSRSASVAVAYVMQTEKISLDRAMARLKHTRPIADPNKNFMVQLRTLENTLGVCELNSSSEEK